MPTSTEWRPAESATRADSGSAALEHEYARFATVVEQANDAILITDTAGTIQYVNPAFERISGYQRDELLGQNPRILKSGKNEPALYENLWDTLSHAGVWKGHLINRRKDGRCYHVDATISPVFDRAGHAVNYVAVTHDVTQEIELETRLRQAEKMEAIGQLASGVAHDFNNVLTAILGHVGLLRAALEKNPAALEPIAGALEQIERSANRAGSLTRQLLNFNRREVVSLESLDPGRVLTDSQPMLRRLLPPNIVFEFNVGPGLHAIHADAGQLDQILMNLMVNARDAMPDGGCLTISATNVELDEAYASSHHDAATGPHVLLSVRDTGCGMTPDVLEHIYEPFFTTKPPGKGTGLGLATVYAIVRRFEAHITVTSAPGEGTEFRVYFPALVGHVAETDVGAVEAAHPRGNETILVCEDDEVIRNLECELLERSGYTVIGAENGEQACELARTSTRRIDLLVTDVLMPQMDGLALADALGALHPRLNVLFVSGYGDEAVAQLDPRTEPEQLLPKPFTSRTFLRRIRTVLDLGEAPGNTLQSPV